MTPAFQHVSISSQNPREEKQQTNQKILILTLVKVNAPTSIDSFPMCLLWPAVLQLNYDVLNRKVFC